jgi:5,10-methylenetetrahydromethanopterin reductase
MYRRGYSHEDIQRLGVDLEDADQLNQAEEAGASAAEFDDLVTDDMVDAIFIAGTPGDCLERMIEVQDTARKQGFHQLMYSELGPDIDEALGLLCDEIIPAL